MALLLGVSLALTGRLSSARAATLTVTNTNDSGGGSLRQAILDASPGDTINFNLPAGSVIALTSGELLINKSLTVNGLGSAALTVQRSTAMGTADFRIFDVDASGATVAISGLTIANGKASSFGGGVALFHGTVTLTGCTISGNSAFGFGGGVDSANGDVNMTIVNCTISGNSVTGNAAIGGGIDNAGTMTITGSTISGNAASGTGDSGGGINNGGMLTITGSTVAGNTSSQSGGGIDNSGTLTITGSTINGNSTTSLQGPTGGGIRNHGGVLTILNSTINGNSVTGGTNIAANQFGGLGGGLMNQALGPAGGVMKIINSTISGNSATGLLANGGGIDTESGSATTLVNTTITNNSASGESSLGGGVRNGGTVNIANTIIAGNSAPEAPDCANSFMSQGYNLIGNSAGCTGFTATGDQLNKNPQLGPLANNGGPMQTHALLCSSPAIDKGSNALAKDQNGALLTTDQRGAGFPRSFNGTVDIGAFESELFTCPANIMVSNTANQCGAVVNYSPPSVDPGCGSVSCSSPPGSFFPVGTTTVTCTFGPGQSCSFTITVADTQAPQIVCPSNLLAVVPQNACPAAGCLAVTYNTPIPTDNCSGVTVACNPPSGSCFPLGATTVNCTATDAAGNTTTCGFSVTVFDVCLQDDASPGNVLLFNSVTGDYRFCCGGTTYTGRGQVTVMGCVIALTHSPADRRVVAKVDRSTFRGSASLQLPVGTIRCSIADRDTRNNSCACQ
jgi:hypothetical protein